jgi:hypothetical protein
MRASYGQGVYWLLAIVVASTACLDSGSMSAEPAPAQVNASVPLPPVVVSRDPKRDVPSFAWGRGAALPDAVRAATARGAAEVYLRRAAPLYRLGNRALAARVVRSERTMRGAPVVVFGQRVDGIDVFETRMTLLLSKDRRLVAIGGALHHAVEDGYSFKRRADDAKAIAVDKLPAGAVLSEPVRVRPVLYPAPDRLVPAYHVVLIHAETGSVTSRGDDYVISAEDGSILMSRSLTEDATFAYRVWADSSGDFRPLDSPNVDQTPHPTGAPNGSEAAFTAPVLVNMESFNTPAVGGPDVWLPSNASDLTGNNVVAYADLVAPDGFNMGDLTAKRSKPGEFDYTYDTAADADANNDQHTAAAVAAFYTVNWLHDYYYDFGFDEAAGNAQTDNYGRGGLGNDAMLVEVQDYDGQNNARMTTPVDGTAPRMQMHVWTGAEQRTLTANGTNYVSGGADWGLVDFNVSAELIDAVDGTAPVADGCEAILTNVTGKIALLDRGNCFSSDKVTNAQTAGAVGVIIANTIAGNPPWRMIGSDPGGITIPVLSVSMEDGATLRAALGAGTVNVTMSRVVGPSRAGGVDSTIVAHEWGHYMRARLSGACYSDHCRASSEGWSDFIALHMALRAGDNFDGTFAVGSYADAHDDNSLYFGLRRVPYSVDFTKNALTLGHIKNSATLPTGVPLRPSLYANSDIHNAGEVWATALFEGYVALLKESQGPSPRYTFDEARRRMADYMVTSMQMVPQDATWTVQRDALLAAADAVDPADALLLAQAFATRGIGGCANSGYGGGVDFESVVEDFSLRPQALLTADVAVPPSRLDCDGDNILDAGEETNIEITVSNVGWADLVGATATVSGANTGLSYPGGDTVAIPTLARGQTAVVTVPVMVNSTVAAAFTSQITAQVFASDACGSPWRKTPLRVYNYDLGVGTTEMFDTYLRPWSETVAIGSPGIWSTTGILIGKAPLTVTDSAMVSPDLVVSATDPLVISYDYKNRWSGISDGGVVELSTDGGSSWQDVTTWGVDPGYIDVLSSPTNPLNGRMAYYGSSLLTTAVLDFGTQLAGQTIKLRFRMGSNDGGSPNVVNQWEISKVSITGIDNAPFYVQDPEDNVCVGGVTANAGPDQTVAPAQLVTLDGSGSTVSGGGSIEYLWQQEGPPGWPVTINGADTANPTFTTPNPSSAIPLTFRLRASSGTEMDFDTVVVTVDPAVPAPDAGVPDASIPDASVPDAASAVPDAGVADASTVAPDASSAAPDANTVAPDANTVAPDANTAAPDANTAAPDAGPAQPDASPGQPDAAPVGPDAGVNPPSESGGCCQAGSRPPFGAGLLTLIVLLGLTARPRRRFGKNVRRTRA